jgi:hypothetical protein
MRRTAPVCLLGLLAAAAVWAAVPSPRPASAQQPERPAAQGRKGYELRLIRVGNTFQSIRFKTETGESWIIVVNKYEKLPENGPVPPGDYDVTLITDGVIFMAFRIDRRTGATWQLKNRQWVKVKEPE